MGYPLPLLDTLRAQGILLLLLLLLYLKYNIVDNAVYEVQVINC
jgi:hypothetical protein